MLAEEIMEVDMRSCPDCNAKVADIETRNCPVCRSSLEDESTATEQYDTELTENPSKLTDEDLGYTDQAWLRGGRYDIDPPKDEA